MKLALVVSLIIAIYFYLKNLITVRIRQELDSVILDSIDIGVAVVDGNLNIKFWNQAVAKILKIPKEKVLGKNIDYVLAGLGDKSSLTINTSLIHNKEGKTIGAAFTFKDATDYKKALKEKLAARQLAQAIRKELTKLRADFQFILESVSVGVVYMDSGWRIKVYNITAEQILGRSRQVVLNKTITKAFFAMPVERRLLVRTMQEGKEYKDFSFPKHLEGEDKQIIADTCLVRREDQEIIGSVMFLRDATENQRMQREIERAEMLSLVGKLAAGTAHEIKNPLTAMRGTLQMMQWRLEKKTELIKELKYVNLLLEEVDRINHVVQEFLLLSRNNHPRREAVELNKIIVDVLAILESEARSYAIKVESDLKEYLPKTEGDKEKLKQVLLNLAQNGFQAMEPGGILKISTNFLPDQESITIKVEDQGSGIAPEILDKIFQYFYTTKKEGTGLGLPICQQIIHEHGGEIEVESYPGRGTIFTVFLPAKIKEVS